MPTEASILPFGRQSNQKDVMDWSIRLRVRSIFSIAFTELNELVAFVMA